MKIVSDKDPNPAFQVISDPDPTKVIASYGSSQILLIYYFTMFSKFMCCEEQNFVLQRCFSPTFKA